MDAGAFKRLRMAAAVGALGVAATTMLALSTGPADSDPVNLLPDLNVQKPFELYVVERSKSTRLRVSNTVANDGAGPLEMYPGDVDDSCAFPGKPEGRLAFQRIFEDSSDPDSPGYFRRADDTTSGTEVAGCMRYHPQHDHWHFDDFAHYSLYREKTGTLVGEAEKVSFCIIDTGHPFETLPGSPDEPYYPQDPEDDDGFVTCSDTSTDGLSVGWEDTYGAGLPGQSINMTGIKGGYFCLRLETDPANQLVEETETNNSRTVRIFVGLFHERVQRLPGACQSPVPL